MQQAAFSITDYRFDKVLIDLSNCTDEEFKLDFAPKGAYFRAECLFQLEFEVAVSSKTGTERPFVSIRCKGIFKFENVTSFDDIPSFFYRNSIAILFPYVRAYLSLVTTQANVRGIILPTYNLSGLEETLRANTIISEIGYAN